MRAREEDVDRIGSLQDVWGGEHAQQAFAAALAIVVTAVFFRTLLILPPIPPWPASDAEPLQVIWISRPPPRVPLPATVRMTTGPASVARSARASPAASGPVAPDAVPSRMPEPVGGGAVTGQDEWSPVPGSGKPPGLSYPTFVRNPLLRPPKDLVAVAPRVRIELQDGSLRGRLQRMSQAAACSHMSRLFRANDSDIARMGTTRQGLAHAMANEGCAPPP